MVDCHNYTQSPLCRVVIPLCPILTLPSLALPSQGDPADAPGPRGGHRGAGRPRLPPPRAPGGGPRPGPLPRHAGLPPAAGGLRGAVQGRPADRPPSVTLTSTRGCHRNG